MKKEEIIQDIKHRLGNDIIDFNDRSERRVYITIRKTVLLDLAKHLFSVIQARLCTLTGVDTRQGIEILYHFSIDELGLIISLRVILDKPNPEIDTLTSLIKGAEWIEREVHEFLGVNFKGHPDLRHLLLKDDWPEGDYPLRRDR